jgi:hypothetical protein
MSRVVELIEQFVTQTRYSETSVASLRFSNEGVSEAGGCSVKIHITFCNGIFDKVLFRCLLNLGSYVDDRYVLKASDGEDVQSLQLVSLEKKFDEISVVYTHEKKPITIDAITGLLQTRTIFGLPSVLFQNFPIANLKIFFGASQHPLSLLKTSEQQLRTYEGHPFIIEDTDSGSVDFLYLDERFTLVLKKNPIRQYISEDILLALTRHALVPKRGVRLTSLFPPELFSVDRPLYQLTQLKQRISQNVENDLEYHTISQVRRISERIAKVQQRARLFSGSIDFGVVPKNEFETILLFQKISLGNEPKLPGGLKISILDYSPKDIDAICKIQLGPNYPEETGPVEFEYALVNFFQHGHDYRQVKVIICYTVGSLVFPYSHAGIKYDLDRSGVVPKLTNDLGDCSVPCLVIEDLFR